MREIRGGFKAPPKRGEYQASKPKRERAPRIRIRDEDDETINVKIKIAVTKTPAMVQTVPGNVWRCSPFVYAPQTFVPESERLNQKFIEPSLQLEGLQSFIADPQEPVVYCVTGNPDDQRAKYFAAFLVQEHMRKLGQRQNVVWSTLYSTYDSSPLKDSFNPNKSRPTLLVLSNLTPNSTHRRLEDARDLLERYTGRIPIIVVAAGEDPLSFMSQRLYSPVNALAYFCGPLVRQREAVE